MTVEAAGYWVPVSIGGFLVVDVHHVDFLHLAPLHALAVQLGDAVGGQVGHLNA